ncbi:MAG TPA: TonB-dependent receptor [Candidatus Acidoferrales bacterium]|nr:TonB-dependent receptor [Candidatus Acidoferrales bacterium]
MNDESGKPVAGAIVKVSSPSQSATATTDNGGHFTFLSLVPDTYTVSVQKDEFSPLSYAGVAVFADQTQTLTFTMQKALKTIARVTSTAPGALVKAGTTSDVYSVNAATAAKVTGLGGGGSLDQAYSAIATMPGAYVPVGGMGWYQDVYIRGGDYDQVGYEVDGVPVNRSFDNYPANTASSLGQQEVQVYTGAAPSNAEGQGLSGFINQVIKTGTYPGYASSDLGIGSSTFYHKANIEVGGASPDRLFSYYAGFGGYNQDARALDNFNGAAYSSTLGYMTGSQCPTVEPTTNIPASCFDSTGAWQGANTASPWYVLGPFNFYDESRITDRDNIINFHFGIPHHHDSGRDDIQLLWQSENLVTYTYSQQGDLGAVGTAYNAYGNPYAAFPYGQVYTGGLNQLFSPATVTGTPNSLAPVQNYCFPDTNPVALGCGGAIPSSEDDTEDNVESIVKLQYQKNFSDSAYLRVYGYTVYSGWFDYGPVSDYLCCTGIPPAYDVYSHSYGFSGTFADQLNTHNLLQVQGSYVTANSQRVYLVTPLLGGYNYPIGVLVNGSNPNSGICYTAAGAAANCDSGAASFGNTQLACAQNPNGNYPLPCSDVATFYGPIPTVAPGTTCGGGACEYDMVDTGMSGENNTVQPRFGSASITDEWDPSDRLHINLGVRFDSFQFVPQNTEGGASDFWYSAWNNSYCTNPSTPSVAPVEKAAPTDTCTADFGAGYVPATISNVSNTQTYTVFQPRVAATFTLNPDNVLRFSVGKYDQAPNTAFEQYTYFDQNTPSGGIFNLKNFYTLGFTNPTHPIYPETSWNYDLSWEHQVKGTDLSWKVTPFFRQTQDQIEEFYLDVQTNFVSGLNIGSQTSEGVEFQLQKGDFSKNGFSGLLSYAYTNAYVKFKPTSNGTTPVTSINQAISQYNAMTSACNGGSSAGKSSYGQSVCAAGVTAAPCYTTGGAAVPVAANCTAADVANPYWNAPVQGFFDPNASYVPYSLFPAGSPGAGGYGTFIVPNVITGVLNYKHDKFAITPALQFSSGSKYGYPINELGIDPSTCTGVLAGVTGDPRYPYGGYGGSYDASTCAQYAIPIPNTDTGKFDGIGAFTGPNRITLSTQLSYEMSPRITAVLTLANLYDGCFGGSTEPWSGFPGVSQKMICSYGAGDAGVGYPPVANNYNPGTPVQPFRIPAYAPGLGTLPFNAYLDFRIRI